MNRKQIIVCLLWCICALYVSLTGCPSGPPAPDGTVQNDGGTADNPATDQTTTDTKGQDGGNIDTKGQDGSNIDTNQPDTTPPDPNRPFGLTKRVANTTCNITGRPDSLATMRVVSAFPALGFNRPLYLTHAGDGSNRIFVVEQGGKILAFPNKPNVARNEVKTFIDISGRVNRGNNEEGLLGLAFHPKFKQNGFFYVYYSAANPRRSVISRFKTKSNSHAEGDPGSEVKVLEIPQFAGNHNGGVMQFGPDGYLYIGVGDGGGAGDPGRHGQNLGTLLATILRIDIDKKDGNKNYAVPRDNPFVNTAGAKPEIWAYGLRNVWRMSFDRDTGTLWAGDVGQSALEEIDIIVKGGNYGWRNMEGTRCYNPRTNCKKPGMILPIVEHGRSEARSITGGYVYRGKRLPSIYGAYVYADYVTGLIWAIRNQGMKLLESKLLVRSNKKIASFGEDEAGELYILAFDGKIYQLEQAQTGPSNFPKTLTKTGCFKSLKPLTPADGLIPYTLRVPFWSDQFDKQRWIALPGTSQITYTNEDAWKFPDGTVIVKHFSYNATKGDDSTKKHVETRFMVKEKGEWRGYSYQWNAAQTEANLVTARTPVAINQNNPGGTPLQFTHTIPSLTDCLGCHTTDAGSVLGLQTLQMNGNFDYGGVVDNQIRAMNNIQLFAQPPPNETTLPKLPKLDDGNAPLQARVKAYLHSNCSHCHRPGTANNGEIDLRYTTSFKDSKACNGNPQEGDLGVTNAKIVVPGAPDRSLLYLRINRRGPKEQMPPFGSALKDEAAISLVKQWIQALNRCP